MKLLMKLLIKLLIKSDWRGIFAVYLIDFQQKRISPGDYPTSSAILKRNPFFMGSVFFDQTVRAVVIQKRRTFYFGLWKNRDKAVIQKNPV